MTEKKVINETPNTNLSTKGLTRVIYSTNTKLCKKREKVTETLAHGYSSESTQRELSNEYQHDSVSMIFKNLCVLVLWIKVVLALEGLK